MERAAEARENDQTRKMQKKDGFRQNATSKPKTLNPLGLRGYNCGGSYNED